MRSSFAVLESPALGCAVSAGAVMPPPRVPASCPALAPATRSRRAEPLVPPSVRRMPRALGAVQRMDPGWPPVLIAAVVAVLVLAIVVVTVMFRRLHGA